MVDQDLNKSIQTSIRDFWHRHSVLTGIVQAPDESLKWPREFEQKEREWLFDICFKVLIWP